MTAVLCDNANHPSGAWHQATPLPFSWQWGKRIHQRLNRERWGCRCSRGNGGEEDGAAAQLGLVSKPVTDEGQQVLGTCSPELRDILTGYRATIEKAWSPATAAPGYPGKTGSPIGQCGVTAAWLQQRFREDHGIDTTYCTGSLRCPYDGMRLGSHCWLEGDGWVADLTSDQISCGLPTWTTPYTSGGCYFAVRRLSPGELAADPVQERLVVLLEALS